MSYTSQTWHDRPTSTWTRDLSMLLDTISPSSHQITSVLALLSASVRSGSPLPPYLQLPQPFALSQRLEQLDKGILSAKHVEEPGYSAYAVMQVASSMVMDDLERLVERVKDLVGEVDFSFNVGPGAGSKGGAENGEEVARGGKQD